MAQETEQMERQGSAENAASAAAAGAANTLRDDAFLDSKCMGAPAGSGIKGGCGEPEESTDTSSSKCIGAPEGSGLKGDDDVKGGCTDSSLPALNIDLSADYTAVKYEGESELPMGDRLTVTANEETLVTPSGESLSVRFGIGQVQARGQIAVLEPNGKDNIITMTDGTRVTVGSGGIWSIERNGQRTQLYIPKKNG